MKYLVIYKALAIVGFAAILPVQAASIAPVTARNGMVVSAHRLASAVGVDVLKKGGNAVDAAVAVGYALAVVYPAAGNLGGGGFMTIRTKDGKTTFLDFRETAPGAATRDMYLDAAGNVAAGRSTRGWLAVGVPGTVAGLEKARMSYGTLSRGALIAPAIALARDGFVLAQGDVDLLANGIDDFRKDPATAAVFLKNGQPYQVGGRLVQKNLARTLKSIAIGGADAFYRGSSITPEILRASSQGKGILSASDFASYTVQERKPITCDYRGYQIISAPPPSSGGVIICEILNILEGYDLSSFGYGSAKAIHNTIEAMRHSYADRNAYLGDPDFVTNPIDRLTSKEYAARIREVISLDVAGDSKSIRPGVPPHEGVNTTHYVVVDQAGNTVSVTYTLNDWFGARVMAGSTGILMNDEMDDFTSKPGVPNLYGLVQGEANIIAPGKRPLSSMSPTIVTKDGQPVLALGTPGGSRIITAVTLTILNMIDYGMNVQEAVDAPRLHQQWLPETTNFELRALSPDTRKILEQMGHKLGDAQPANHVVAIAIGAPAFGGKPVGDNRFYGANDPRRNTGLAVGY